MNWPKDESWRKYSGDRGAGSSFVSFTNPEPMQAHPITRKLEQTSQVLFIIYAAVSAFCLYTCIFALRKAFGVATYGGMTFAGLGFKSWMVILQVVGYMLSKFIGIKVVSELAAGSRARGILIMVTVATLSWLLFAITPTPWNLGWLFFNGLPLGMVWGMVFGYMEGRRATEVLGAALSVSFIFSSGFAKTIGGMLMEAGITEMWMPFVTSAVFFPPLLLFLFLLDKIPPPNAEDVAMRTLRAPMTGPERMRYVREFLPGLVFLVLAYMLLTAFRDFRDNFSAEIWIALGYGGKPGIFTYTESIISVVVLVVIGSLMAIRSNYRAMIINHGIVIAGMVLVGVSTLLFRSGLLEATPWMILVGMGLYFGYIQFNSIFFDRLIAAFRYVSTVGFLIYLADAFGYLRSVSVILYREIGGSSVSWLDFFVASSYVLSVAGAILMTGSLLWFIRKYRDYMKA